MSSEAGFQLLQTQLQMATVVLRSNDGSVNRVDRWCLQIQQKQLKPLHMFAEIAVLHCHCGL